MATGARLMLCTTIILCAVSQSNGLASGVVEVREKFSFLLVMRDVSRASSEDICSVQAPMRNKPYRLDPLVSGDSPDERIRFSNTSKDECGVAISNADPRWDAGSWRIYVTNATGTYSQVFTVHVVVPTRNVIPKMSVSVVEGQDLYLRFEGLTVTDVVECRVNWTNHEVVLTPGNVVDPLVAYWGTGLEKDCGVKATHINVTDSGTWTLRALNTTGHVVEGTFEVTVESGSFPNETEKIFVTGDLETLTLGANNSRYCQAQNPSGQWDEIKRNACSVKLGSVTKAHEGKWTARFAVPGQINELQSSVSVRVKDMDSVYTSVLPSKRHPGGLDLLCHWTTYQYARMSATYCRFIRPDGLAMSLEDGIGGAGYSYFGDGLNFSYSDKDCGVTIHKPQNRDVGTWQCLIGADLLDVLKGGFIHVPSTSVSDVETFAADQNNRDIRVTGGEKIVVVQDQNPLTLGCHATATLNYCWFGHPNGSTLTTHGDSSSNSRARLSKTSGFSYTGLGLGLGDCTITITLASHMDAGNWTCNMGMKGGIDLKVSIAVIISDGNMAAHVPQLNYDGSASAVIRCITIPEGVALQYCRFVRPDGVGFGFTSNGDEVISRYRYDGAGLERGVCGLKMDTVTEVDFGQWTCAALHVGHSIEGKAHIGITDHRVLSGGAVAGIVIGSIIAVVALGAMVYLYRKHRTRM